MRGLRRPWILATALLLGVAPLSAEIEVTPSLGFQSSGTLDSLGGDLEVSEGANVALAVSVRVRPDGLVEILYSRQETILESRGETGAGRLFDLAVEYLHFGGLWEIRQGRRRPFLGLSLGATRLTPQASGISDEWLFSGAISGGAKVFLNGRVGLRIEGRGLLSLVGSEGDVFCGFPPGQCGLTVSGTPMFQIDTLIGVTIVL